MPLLLITLLARHWGLRHRCKFRWLVDSQFAINRVTSVTSPQYGPTNQPDNADYLSVIRELHTELRRPLSMKWIKSHQDEKREYYTKLSQGAQHNVNVDALATKFHILPKAKPSRTTAHITATNKSIAINRMRFYGNLDANIRFHINGGCIRNYLQTKHSWANRAWDKINMPAFGCHMEKLSAPHHTLHAKFIHDILPLGNHKRHLSKTKDSTIRLCPCCLTEDEVSNEDHHHFIRCKANPSRVAALNKLIKDIRLDDTHHPFGTAMSICLTDTLQDPNTPLQIQNASRNRWKKPSTRSRLAGKWRYEALSQQNGTLWHRKIFLDTKRPIHSQRHHEIHQTLLSLHLFTQTLWLGCNEVLHRIKDGQDAETFLPNHQNCKNTSTCHLIFYQAPINITAVSLCKSLQSSPFYNKDG